VTQHLATFNKILVPKGSLSDTKRTEIAFIIGWGSAETLLGRRIPLPIPLLSECMWRLSVQSGFFKYDHSATLAVDTNQVLMPHASKVPVL